MTEFSFTIPAGLDAGVLADSESRFAGCRQTLLHQGQLIATNGRAMSVLPVEGNTKDQMMLLPPKSVKALAKQAATVTVNGDVRTLKGKSETVERMPQQEGRFPAVACCMPELNQEGVVSVGVDIDQLWNLVSAISPSKKVTLFLQRHDADMRINRPIAVVGLDGGVGVIVPLVHERQACKDFYKNIVAQMPNSTIEFKSPPAEAK